MTKPKPESRCAGSRDLYPSFRLHLETWQSSGWHRFYGNAQRKCILEIFFKPPRECERPGAFRRRFDLDAQFGQRMNTVYGDLVLRHIAAGADDVFDSTGEYIHAADYDHVIHASEYATFQSEGVTAANARLRVDGRRSTDRFDEIPGAVTEQRRADAAERGQHELTLLAGFDGFARRWFNNLGEVGGFDDVQNSGLLRAFVGDRAGFRHAVVIEDASAMPQLLKSCPERRDAAARFARDDESLHFCAPQIDFLFGGDFCQPQGVGGCATKCRRAIVDHQPQSRRAAEAAARNAKAAEALRRLEREPESDERPEGKRKEDAIPRGHARGTEDFSPAFHHPVPALRRVEPADRRPGGSAVLMKARVSVRRIRQVRAVRRVGALVIDDFLLGCKRERFRKLLQARDGRAHSRKLACVERIRRNERREQPAQLLELGRNDRRPGVQGILSHRKLSADPTMALQERLRPRQVLHCAPADWVCKTSRDSHLPRPAIYPDKTGV